MIVGFNAQILFNHNILHGMNSKVCQPMGRAATNSKIKLNFFCLITI
uniref:Uncharacterized protein n=1 Tax=Rhizophora mucronata TaxID=61149 RepID=A0A2P2K4G0_RHIMU